MTRLEARLDVVREAVQKAWKAFHAALDGELRSPEGFAGHRVEAGQFWTFKKNPDTDGILILICETEPTVWDDEDGCYYPA